MCQSGSHAVPDFVAFGAGAVKEVRSTALLCVLIAGPLDFTGSLAFVLDDFPVALGAGPVNTGWGGKDPFLGAAPLMENARDCCVERLIAEFASEVGFSRAVASEFVSIAELRRPSTKTFHSMPGVRPALSAERLRRARKSWRTAW